MNLTLTLAAIETFEDATGTGLLALVDGSDVNLLRSRWTVRRMRHVLQATEAGTPEDIEKALAPGRVVETQLSIMAQVIDQLNPPDETDDYLPREIPGQGGTESDGNFRSAVGSSSSAPTDGGRRMSGN